MIGGQDEDSCGKSGSNEEAHRPPAESEVLHGNQQRCHKRFIRAPLSYWFVFKWDGFSYVSTSFFMNHKEWVCLDTLFIDFSFSDKIK
ncbi:hypothetical protein [Priestia megaterium]|uniref:hypothetical protein n=1 Tax=Priestia megaterium TaxID=1404 RepID=UPI003CEEDCEB